MAAEPQLTPACELAFAVARQGIEASPPVEAPAALRPFLHLRPPSRRALRAAHRALDDDASFRQRVAVQAATDDFVGPVGWLFLHRPDGWDAELARLTAGAVTAPVVDRAPAGPAVAAAEPAGGLERELHALRSLVEGLVADGSVLAGATIRQLEEQVATLTGERDELASALGATAAERDRAVSQAAASDERLAAVDARLADVTAARVEAEDRLARVLADHADALSARQAELAELTGLLVQVEADRVALAAELARTSAHVADVRDAFERAVHRAADEVVGWLDPSLTAAGGVVRSIGESVERARSGAERLAGEPAPDAWAAAPTVPAVGPRLVPTIDPLDPLDPVVISWLDDEGTHTGASGWPTPEPLEDGTGSGPEGPRAAWSNPNPEPQGARRPVEVPGDLLDDALSAARFLASVPDVILLIDGDAVAALGWPALTVAEQRDALVSYLGDLAGTCGAAADVVFGGDVGEGSPLPVSDVVRVRLTSPGIPVHRAVLGLIDTYPVDWPVVVVTDAEDLAAAAGRAGSAVLSAMGMLDLFIAP